MQSKIDKNIDKFRDIGMKIQEKSRKLNYQGDPVIKNEMLTNAINEAILILSELKKTSEDPNIDFALKVGQILKND